MAQEEQKIKQEDGITAIDIDTDYTLLLNKPVLYIFDCLLFGIVCAVLSILTTRSVASSDGGVVYAFFVSVLVVALTIKRFKAFGIITAIISSILFCVALKIGFVKSIINVGVNTLQAVLIYSAFKIINLIEKKNKGKDKQINKIWLNIFAIVQFMIGIIFTCIEFVKNDTVVALRVFTVIEIVLFAIFSICQKKSRYIYFLLILCLAPSLISGVLNGLLQFDESWQNRGMSIEVWTLSNFILLATFGFIFIERIHPETMKQKLIYGEIKVKITTIIYFAASLLWNSIIFIVFYVGWLGDNLLPFVLPWLVGNMFLLANLYFNSHVEVTDDKKTNAFKWYEDRAVVAEKNTQFLISIITFLLPISSSLFDKNLNSGIITIFCINITCACLSIGLIWIPNKEVRAMSLIKTLKTVFHLLTVSFLLLSATMIIV